jgi:hypothetical protein
MIACMSITIDAGTTIGRIGTDPEYADALNPLGHIYADVPVVIAQTSYGLRYSYQGEIVDAAHAERLAAIFTFQAAAGRLDLDTDEWYQFEYVYGSQAFHDEYTSAEASLDA